MIMKSIKTMEKTEHTFKSFFIDENGEKVALQSVTIWPKDNPKDYGIVVSDHLEGMRRYVAYIQPKKLFNMTHLTDYFHTISKLCDWYNNTFIPEFSNSFDDEELYEQLYLSIYVRFTIFKDSFDETNIDIC